MKSPVKVDLSSAVVGYRPAAGEERTVPAHELKATALFDSYPWRTFRSYDKQKHYSGTYWSSTLSDHVRSCPETGVNGAGRRFCFETYQVIEERTYARACTSIAD